MTLKKSLFLQTPAAQGLKKKLETNSKFWAVRKNLFN